MSYDRTGTFAVCVFAGAMIIIAIFLAIDPSENKFMKLGDEVATTDEYNTLFNESFSGHIITIDKLYTVRDENGNERTFEWKWVDHVDAEGDI